MVTEQYPEKLGSTVCELDIKHACAVVPKSRFSMLVPPIEEKIKDIFNGKPKTAVLFGIEASCIALLKFNYMY